MYKELKAAIIQWLLDHESTFSRVNECHREFRPYIYDAEGNYLIGGQNVSSFIEDVDRILSGREY